MDLKELAAEYGVRNLRFFIPLSKLQYAGFIPGIAFRTSGQPEEIKECVIDESHYKVEDGYKIKLRALDIIFGGETYYQSDLEAILRQRPDFKVYVVTIDGYTQIPNSEFDL
jgi:hypothetical protein